MLSRGLPSDVISIVPLRIAEAPRGGAAAIVFVHGAEGLKETWGAFPHLLEAEPRLRDWHVYSIGYAAKLLPDSMGIWASDPGLAGLAKVSATALLHSDLKDCQSLALLAHSAGGLIVQRLLLSCPEIRKRVGHVFLFGTPSAGLKKDSPFKFWKRQPSDLDDQGAFIKQLRADWDAQFATPRPFRLLAIAGQQDQFVPAESSLGPFPEPEQRLVPGDHRSMVNPRTHNDLSFQVMLQGLTGKAAAEGPGNALRVAVEMRRFHEAVEKFWPHRAELDDEGAVQLALALEAVGRRQDAVQLLEQHQRRGSDILGVLAGRFKRFWLLDHRRADAEKALELYQKGCQEAVAKGDAEQAYYMGINVAFLHLAYRKDYEAAAEMAQQVLAQCEKAEDAGNEMWRLATQGEAHLILGSVLVALESYEGAVACGPSPRELDSMRQQALRIADLRGYEPDVVTKLTKVFLGKS